eukprot:TRINITY_DN4848_c0_g1_i2.p1 TRINITY_DN4848_c0_g1~~TRINITY_DN4848_c0_g1_i2.p1  ORF type:complete len:1104 (-),score=200.10 TRINITY_DN4848_c0_g1_i2:48-3359(-)
MAHKFVLYHFNKPTWCQVCSKFIWGIGKQGFCCTDCKFSSHKECLSKCPANCGQVKDKDIKDNTNNNRTSLSTNAQVPGTSSPKDMSTSQPIHPKSMNTSLATSGGFLSKSTKTTDKKPITDLNIKNHDFESHHFKRPRWCDICKTFIWGIGNQGFKCKVCTLSVHYECVPNMIQVCPRARLGAKGMSSGPSDDSTLAMMKKGVLMADQLKDRVNGGAIHFVSSVKGSTLELIFRGKTDIPPYSLDYTEVESLSKSINFSALEIQAIFFQIRKTYQAYPGENCSYNVTPKGLALFFNLPEELGDILYKLLKPIDFQRTVKNLAILCRGTPREQMTYFFECLLQTVTAPTPITTATHIEKLYSFIADHVSLYSSEMEQDTIQSLKTVLGTNQKVSLSDFLNNFDGNAVVSSLLGLLPYMNQTIGHYIEQFIQQPEFEGFTVKKKKIQEVVRWIISYRGLIAFYKDPLDPAPMKIYNLRGVALAFDDNLKAISLSNIATRSTEKMEIVCQNVHQYEAFKIHMNAVSFENKYQSFAPERPSMHAEWYVDGKPTYESMYAEMLKAKETIFIADWFLSPETYLIRSETQPPLIEHRLDNLLKKKADEGVRIFVLVWCETKVLHLNSSYVKYYLESLSPHIRVLPHPLTQIVWSHHQKLVIIDQDTAFVGGLDMCFGRYDNPEHKVIDTDSHIWVGKDYYNPGIKDLMDVNKHLMDSFDRTVHPRMPWHDVHMMCRGQVARDVAHNFVQRWNHHKLDKRSDVQFIWAKKSIIEPTGTETCQVLRSVSQWSCGVPTEKSILNAYLSLISNAEHFIYIENQYFISDAVGGAVNPIQNEIAKALVTRIKYAHNGKQNFRIIVIVPISPEGNYKDDKNIRCIMKYQFETIGRDKHSIYELLLAEGIDWRDYISFHALRSYAFLNDVAVTEQIYVHTKMMIVDDRQVIIGSSNINDRSMCGDRDSEIAILVSSGEPMEIQMNGEPYTANKFAHTLRMQLWREHLGFLDNSNPNATYLEQVISDPVSKATWDEWKETSRRNTELFFAVFNNIPHDSFVELQMLRDRLSLNPLNPQRLKDVRGHLVDFPIDFLKAMNLNILLFDNSMSSVGAKIFQ